MIVTALEQPSDCLSRRNSPLLPISSTAWWFMVVLSKTPCLFPLSTTHQRRSNKVFPHISSVIKILSKNLVELDKPSSSSFSSVIRFSIILIFPDSEFQLVRFLFSEKLQKKTIVFCLLLCSICWTRLNLLEAVLVWTRFLNCLDISGSALLFIFHVLLL